MSKPWPTVKLGEVLRRVERFEPRDELTEYAFAGTYSFARGIFVGARKFGSTFGLPRIQRIRSGDFIQALLRVAKDLHEYAFAVGALAHFAADNYGHRLGTNRAVPLLYPGLRKKFGDSVSYEDGKLAHVKTEFGFDVLQIARERYAPDSYHDFIGFEVSRAVLEQAFRETYGLELTDVLGPRRPNAEFVSP